MSNITIGVTGSISAYKSIDLMRSLLKAGHQVKIILTKGALKFVRPETYSYLGAEAVYTDNDDFELSDSNILHIELANWTEKFVVSPLSANTLSKLVSGQASDLLSCVFLALGNRDIPKIYFPAMNTKMLSHPFVKDNLNKLSSLPNTLIHPTIMGELACKEVGMGKLADIEEMSLWIESRERDVKAPLKFLITTGATLTPLDPVRFMTNSSSGKTGLSLLIQGLKRGHLVTLIYTSSSTSSIQYFKSHPKVKLIEVKTNSDLYKAAQENFKSCDVYISSAAISDFKFKQSQEKLKKDSIKKELAIEADTDILKEMIKLKDHQVLVGFAAETNLNQEMLSNKIAKKPVELLVGTKVDNGLIKSQKVEGFSNDSANYLLLKDKEFIEKSMTKNQLAEFVIEFSETKLLNQHSQSGKYDYTTSKTN